MHDCKGRPLAVGDTVLVPFKVKETYATEEFCNVSLVTVASMFPGALRTNFTANTQQVIRANTGDETSYEIVPEDGGAQRIR